MPCQRPESDHAQVEQPLGGGPGARRPQRFSRIPSDFHVLKRIAALSSRRPGKARHDLYRRSGFWVTGSQEPWGSRLTDPGGAQDGLPGPALDMDPADIQALKDFAEEIRRYIVHDVGPHAISPKSPRPGRSSLSGGGDSVNFARLSEMRVSYLRIRAGGTAYRPARENFVDLAILTEQEQRPCWPVDGPSS